MTSMTSDTGAGTGLIAAIKAERSTDADAMFARVVEDLRRNGYRVGGVRQLDAEKPGRRKCEMRLLDLTSGHVTCISEDRGNDSRGCRLDHRALTEAAERVCEAIRQGVDLVIVNKFGKAESEGHGMRDVIALALETGTPTLVCATPEHHDTLIKFCGDFAVSLPLQYSAVLDWFRRIRASRGGADTDVAAA